MKIFIIMPFDKKFDDIYDNIKLAMQKAVPGEQIYCYRLDEIRSAGRITDDLISEIEKALLCIADVSGNNPNVMWEVGYAMALKKPVIAITQHHELLPFDIRDMRVIEYDRDRLSVTLRESLVESIKATLAKYEVRRESRTIKMPERISFNVAITGSMRAEPARCKRRVQSLLHPYIGENTTWYVGSFGAVDETTAEYLGSIKQKVIVVGYHSYDISESMFEIMEKYDFPFVDAQKEQLPKGMDAPTERDLLFAIKADLVILIWNGKSLGTKELIEWYKLHGKDHIVGFI